MEREILVCEFSTSWASMYYIHHINYSFPQKKKKIPPPKKLLLLKVVRFII